MLARQIYRAGLCPNCGHPKDTAWHPDNDGYFEVVDTHECHACTAIARHSGDSDTKPVEFLTVLDTRDYAKEPLPPVPLPGRLSETELDEAMGGAV